MATATKPRKRKTTKATARKVKAKPSSNGRRRKKTKYRASHGARFNDTDAQVIGESIDRLEKAGMATAVGMVTDARKRHSPLHGFFEWDDTAAAHQYRLTEARCMIRHVEIVITTEDGAEEGIRAFHHVDIRTEDDDRDARYASVAVIRTKQAYADHVIERAKAELIGWKQRYGKYRTVFATVFNAIDGL